MFKRPNFDRKIMRAFVIGLIVGCLLTLGIAGVSLTLLLAHQRAEVERMAEKAMQQHEQAQKEAQKAEEAMREVERLRQ